MATCPLTRRENAGVYKCLRYLDRSTCGGCPAYGWRARLMVLVRWLCRLSLPVVIAVTATLTPFAVTPVRAAHNETHTCEYFAQQIREGRVGGNYWQVGGRMTWSDYQTFAVFLDGVCVTLYAITNKSYKAAVKYVLNDAASHGAKLIGRAAAVRYFQGVSAGLLVVPQNVVCEVTQAWNPACARRVVQ